MVGKVKKAISEKNPVVIGLFQYNSLILDANKVWIPNTGSNGHAMVVVGYDDNLASFRIFNSWGPKWGKNGMIWVKYNEFAKYCKYAYIIYVGQNKPIQKPANQVINSSPIVASSNEALPEGILNELPLRDISGKFNFLRFTGQFNSYSEPVFEEAKVLGEKNIYTLSNRLWKVGDKFQLQVVPSFSNGYIYVLSIDPTNKKEVHWPKNEMFNAKFKGEFQSGLSPFSEGVIKIPDANSVLKLAHPGTDHLIILFSEKKNKRSLYGIFIR